MKIVNINKAKRQEEKYMDTLIQQKVKEELDAMSQDFEAIIKSQMEGVQKRFKQRLENGEVGIDEMIHILKQCCEPEEFEQVCKEIFGDMEEEMANE